MVFPLFLDRLAVWCILFLGKFTDPSDQQTSDGPGRRSCERRRGEGEWTEGKQWIRMIFFFFLFLLFIIYYHYHYHLLLLSLLLLVLSLLFSFFVESLQQSIPHNGLFKSIFSDKPHCFFWRLFKEQAMFCWSQTFGCHEIINSL